MALALFGADPASVGAHFKLAAQNCPIGLSLPRAESARYLADVSAVQIQTNAPDQFADCGFCEAIIGACCACLCTVVTGVNAAGKYGRLVGCPSRVRTQHFLCMHDYVPPDCTLDTQSHSCPRKVSLARHDDSMGTLRDCVASTNDAGVAGLIWSANWRQMADHERGIACIAAAAPDTGGEATPCPCVAPIRARGEHHRQEN
jgi:hypothetical protein